MNARVFIAEVSSYDEGAIAGALERALDTLGEELPGERWVGKANWVFAGRWAADCYTHPTFLTAALDVLLRRRPGASMTLVGNSGLGVPTRAMARRAGVDAVLRRFPGRVRIEPTDEARLARFRLTKGRPLTPAERSDPGARAPDEARFWEAITTSAALADADAVIYFPKLKSNVLSGGLSGACKLGGIGLLTDRDRLTGHNWHNDRRIADMLDVAAPDLVVTDAIRVAWGGNQMTEPGVPLGVILVATNAVAHDAVCARILGLEPERVEHLRLAAARGHGPIEAARIEVLGDAAVATLARRMAGFGASGLIPVEGFPGRFAAETGQPFPLEIVSGPPHESAGSQGILLDWLYMSYDHPRFRERMARWPAASVFVGAVDAVPRYGTVYLVGDFAMAAFRARARVRTWLRVPERVRRRLGGFTRIARWSRDGRRGWAVEIAGDPPSHRDLIAAFFAASRGRMRAPLLTSGSVLDAYLRTILQQLRSWWRNRRGIPEVEAHGRLRRRAQEVTVSASAP